MPPRSGVSCSDTPESNVGIVVVDGSGGTVGGAVVLVGAWVVVVGSVVAVVGAGVGGGAVEVGAVVVVVAVVGGAVVGGVVVGAVDDDGSRVVVVVDAVVVGSPSCAEDATEPTVSERQIRKIAPTIVITDRRVVTGSRGTSRSRLRTARPA